MRGKHFLLCSEKKSFKTDIDGRYGMTIVTCTLKKKIFEEVKEMVDGVKLKDFTFQKLSSYQKLNHFETCR